MRSVLAIDINQDTFAPARIASIGSLLNVVIPTIWIVASILFLFMFLVGGFRMLTAGGNQENVEKSQLILKWALVGFGIIVLSFFLTKLIGYITNVAIPL